MVIIDVNETIFFLMKWIKISYILDYHWMLKF